MTIANADNKGLEPEMTWGIDARLYDGVPEYVPTGYELLVLAKHYAREDLDVRWMQANGLWSGYQTQYKIQLRQRIDRIVAASGVGGAREVRKAIDEVYVQFQAELDGGKLWDLCGNEDKRVRRGVQRRFWRDVERATGRPLPATVQGRHAKARAEAT